MFFESYILVTFNTLSCIICSVTYVSDQACKLEFLKLLFKLTRLELLESGARDASDFLNWQARMRQNDMETKLAEIERRLLEGQLSHEQAIIARQTLVLENRNKAQQMKEQVKLINFFVYICNKYFTYIYNIILT